MTYNGNEIHSEFESFEPVSRPDHSGKVGETINPSHADHLADILFEQLEYLLQHCHEERERLSRVTTVLLEVFH
jgi:hypothetical protein